MSVQLATYVGRELAELREKERVRINQIETLDSGRSSTPLDEDSAWRKVTPVASGPIDSSSPE